MYVSSVHGITSVMNLRDARVFSHYFVNPVCGYLLPTGITLLHLVVGKYFGTRINGPCARRTQELPLLAESGVFYIFVCLGGRIFGVFLALSGRIAHGLFEFLL